MPHSNRRVVVTGMGVVSPIGNSPEALWNSLTQGESGIDFLSRIPNDHLPSKIGGEVTSFTGSIDDFGDLEKQLKRNIKKGLKLMCREIEMGVASAQHAISDANLSSSETAPERIGTMFGSDYIITEPSEFNSGIRNCLDDNEFTFEQWGENGISQVEPLWLLKYLPNMPASHVAIYNDFRGPSNSLTVREASSNIAIAEATTIIQRDIADCMVVGATGSRIHPLRSVHVALQEQLAQLEGNGSDADPATASRPFDVKRTGMVMGEGAGTLILEELNHAQKRGAKIYAEVVGYSSSTVASRNCVANYQMAFENVIQGVFEKSNIAPNMVGHINAHGLGTVRCDREEAAAISTAFGEKTPVVAVKSYTGNLGAGGGMVEAVASIQSLEHQHLFATLNFENADSEESPIGVVTHNSTESGDCFINLNVTPQGQASASILKKFVA